MSFIYRNQISQLTLWRLQQAVHKPEMIALSTSPGSFSQGPINLHEVFPRFGGGSTPFPHWLLLTAGFVH
jgi:hypothetical protein